VQASLNGTRLWFDIEGAGLVADGPRMRTKPTLILLHGGPGFDHSGFKPSHGAFADIAQIVYVDHRGMGRSAYSDPAQWTLDQWADDLRALVDLLGIDRPVVLGHSFGGFVAQSYALRHTAHLSKLILSSTAAKFRRDRCIAAFGRMHGTEAERVAAAFWHDPDDAEAVRTYLEICFPLYNRTGRDPDAAKRTTLNPAVLAHFFRDGGEGHRFDFRARLKDIACPTLVLSGALDPVTTREDAEDLAASLPPDRTRLERFADCGHGIVRDDPARYAAVVRDFLASES
jgi:proline-specific peptidase